MPYTSLIRNSLSVFFRLSGYHIMSMLVSMSIRAFITDIVGAVIAQFVCLGIIIVLPYLTVWKWGDSDCNKIDNDRMTRDNGLGFKVGFIAYAPYLLMGILLIIARIGLLPDTILSWYRLLETPFMPLNQSLMPTTMMLSEQSYSNIIISILIMLSVPISIGIAYYMGIHRISFSEAFGFAKHDNSRKQ